MPAVIPIVAATAFKYTAWEAAAFLIAVSLYGGYQERKLRRQAAGAGDDQRADNLRQPISHHRIVYGTQRAGGALTFAHATDGNQYLNLVVTLAAHEVAQIGDLFFNDEYIPLRADGSVDGRWSGYATIYKGLGSTAGDAALLAALQANCPGVWTVDHKQEGRAKIYARLRWNPDLLSGGIPTISAIVKGKKLYDPRSATTAWSDNAALVIRDYLTGAHGVGAASAEIDDTALGAAANICDEFVVLTDAASGFAGSPGLPTPPAPFTLTSIIGGNISAQGVYSYSVTFYDASGETPGSHTLVSGKINIYLSSDYSFNVQLDALPLGPSGTTGRKIYRSLESGGYGLVGTVADNVTTTFVDDVASPGAAIPSANTTKPAYFEIATEGFTLLTGDRVQLSTTGTLPGGFATATNYYGIFLGEGRFNLATSLANALAGTAIDIANPGSGTHTVTRQAERRYTANGMVTLAPDQNPESVLREMLTAIAGSLHQIAGQWTLLAGAWRAPAVTLDENDLDGPIQVTSRLGRSNLCNAVKGLHVNPAKHWQPTDFPGVVNATYLTEDGNERIWRDIELPWTLSPAAAQRIAKIELERTRQQITTRWPCKLTAFKVQTGDVIGLSNTRFGWSAKPFEVVDFEFVPRGDAGAPRLGIDLFLRETASTVYDWNSGEETVVDPAPDTNLPDPFDVTTPTGLAAESGTAHLYLRKDGAVFSRLYLSWTQSADLFVRTGGFIELRWRLTTDSGWTYSEPLPGDATFHYVLDVSDRDTYLIQIRARTYLGPRSEWSAIVTHTVVGKTQAPTNVTGFKVERLSDGTRRVSWINVADLDVKSGGGYRVRYRSGSWSDYDDLLPLHDGLLKSSPHETNQLAAGVYTFGIVAVDSSGNESAVPTLFQTTLGDPRLGGSILEVDPVFEGWPGTKVNCWVDEYKNLVIADTMTWDTMASFGVVSWDTWTSWAMAPYAQASYQHPEIDLGAVYTFTLLVSVVGTANITVEESHSTDGVSYTAYALTGELITARYVRLRITLEVPT